jgi:nucleotide-binding universal stress UspA family protein
MSFQKILVAIDDSQLSPPVFTAALELAQLNKGVIRLLHCLTPELVSEPAFPRTLDTGFPLGIATNDYQDYETQKLLLEKQTEEAQAILKRYGEEAMSHGVPTETEYQVGEAGHLLCEVAKDWGADLIVVGRRGRTGLAEALLGSVSNHVVHHAPCAVLVIQDVTSEPVVIPATEFLSQGINPSPNQELA